jgi:hypothetical protein
MALLPMLALFLPFRKSTPGATGTGSIAAAGRGGHNAASASASTGRRPA